MMTIKRIVILLIALSLLGNILFVPSQTVHAASIPYIDLRNRPLNRVDTLIRDNQICTLRKAIIAINNHATYDGCQADATTTTILLPDDGGVTLSVQIDGSQDTVLSGDLNIRANMNIIGTSDKSAVGFDVGASHDRVFNIVSGYKVTMSGFTIHNGTAKSLAPNYESRTTTYGGGILNYGSDLTLQNMTLESNYADTAGGGIASVGAGSKLTMSVVNVINNSTKDSPTGTRGGGVYNEGSMRLENSYFFNNITSAVYQSNLVMSDAGVVNNTTFSANRSGIISSGSLVLSYLTLVDNTNNGIYLNPYSWTDLRDSLLSNNGGSVFGDNNCGRDGTSAKFVDGGYNVVTPNIQNTALSSICPYNNGEPTSVNYHTLVGNDGDGFNLNLIGPAVVSPNTTSVYSFDGTSKLYNFHPAEAGICVPPALPGGGNPYSVTIPSLPGYDQYLGPRPTNAEGDAVEGCDTGAYEAGAYLAKPHIYMPTLRKFN